MNGTENKKYWPKVSEQNMTDAQKLAAYFKDTQGWTRIMKALLQKYESLGCRGNIKLDDASADECNAVNSIIRPKKAFVPPKLKFSLSAFEEGLRNTQYHNITLKDVLEAYFCREIQTKQEKQEIWNLNWETFEHFFFQEYQNTPSGKWLTACFAERTFGYQRLMRLYQNDRADAKRILEAVCRAVNARYENPEPIQLALLSAEITGNAHFFDRTAPAGRLLLDALAHLAGLPSDQNIESISAVYAAYSIEPDTFSGAAALGIRVFYENQLEHPAYHYFADAGEVCMITMANLTNICRACSDKNVVFIVENPMVFSALTDTAVQCGAGLLCTFGQLKLSGLHLVDLLVKSGCKIYYAGDFDPEGLQIADKLICRYTGGAVQSWHMSCQDYLRIEKADDLPDFRLHKLKQIQSAELKNIAAQLCEERKSAHQELLIAAMKQDMLRICMNAAPSMEY